MSSDTAVDVRIPIVYARWTVKKTWFKEDICSSTFKFHGREWYLRHSYLTSYYPLDHCVKLITTNNESYGPLDLSLNVESSYTGRIIPELTQKKRIDQGTIGWLIPDEDILRLDPAYGQSACITFLLVLKEVGDPLTDTDSKAIQTECNDPPEDISASSRSTMTTLLPTPTLCLESLSEDLAKLMVQDSDLDVEFQCGGECTKAHSNVVSARSPVIASMLASNMTEGRTKVVKIPSMEPEIFQQFLRYLYSGKLDELTVDTAISLYGTGQQYAVHALAKRCSDFLIDHLSVENACEVLFVADAHSDADFAKAAIEFLVEHKVPASGGSWLDFCDKHPKLASIVLTHYCQRLPK